MKRNPLRDQLWAQMHQDGVTYVTTGHREAAFICTTDHGKAEFVRVEPPIDWGTIVMIALVCVAFAVMGVNLLMRAFEMEPEDDLEMAVDAGPQFNHQANSDFRREDLESLLAMAIPEADYKPTPCLQIGPDAATIHEFNQRQVYRMDKEKH